MGKSVRAVDSSFFENDQQPEVVDDSFFSDTTVKKKDGGGPSKAAPLDSTPMSATTGQQPIALGSEYQSIDYLGIAKAKPAKVTTKDGFDLNIDKNKLPDIVPDKDKAVAGLQKRIANGDYSSDDIQNLSKLTGKSRASIEGYLKDSKLGLATEDQEQLQQKSDDLKKSVDSFNKEMGTILDPKDVLSSADKTSAFIQQMQQAKKKLLDQEAQRVATLKADPNGITYSVKNGQIVTTPNKDLSLINADPNALLNKIQEYQKLLEDHTVKLTIDEDKKNGVAPDKTVFKIAQRLDPVGLFNAEKAKIDAINPDPSNPIKGLGQMADMVFGTKDKDDLLNSIKGEAELKYQNGLRELAVNKISTGITHPDDPKSQQLIKDGQEQLKQVDDNAIYKYPALVKRDIARKVSEQIAKETGQLQGSQLEGSFLEQGLRFNEKMTGAKTEDYIRVMQQLGYFDDPKTKDAANQLIGQQELFSDPSYLGSFGNSVLQPIKDLGYSLGDISGFRNARDVYASKVSDDLFPKETANLKDHVSVVRNIVNTTGNLVGMTAIAVGTEGAGEAAGFGAKAASRLGAYTSFGLPSFDAAYKESYNFLDNDAARGLYATMTAITNAEGGRLLDLGKVARIPGVSDAIATIADGAVNKTIGRDAAKELLNQQQNQYVAFALKYGKNVTTGAATMAYFNATDNILKATFGDPSVKSDDIIPQTAHAFFGGILGMSIMGAWGAAADMRKESNTTYKGTIYSMALNPDAAADVFKIALDNGSIDKAEYTNKMSVLNGAKMAKDVVELAAQEKKLDLTHDQKAVFVANKTVEGVLKQKRDNTQSEPEKEKIQSQIDRLHAQSNEIFDGLKFNEVLEPLYDLHNAEKEYNKALDDVKAGRITDSEFEAKKHVFEKLQYNYFEGGMEKTAKDAEVKRLLKKGIAGGQISDEYKGYEEHPDHLLKFIANQSQGVVEDSKGNVTEHGLGGNEAGMRDQFGDALVDHALESHPLKAEEKPQPIIVRHAETEQQVPGEPENKNPQLTDTGKKQAEQLGKDFKEKGVTQIISSPVDRSLDTANIAAKESGASVKQDERLAEYDPNKETLDTFANRVSDAMSDVKKLGSETAVVTHGAVLSMVEALDKNNGDVETAKKDFENSKEYGNTEQYVPPKGISVIQPGDIQHPETTIISPKTDNNETKEAKTGKANAVTTDQGAATENVTAPSLNPAVQAYRDSAARLRAEGDEDGANKLDEQANLIESGGTPPVEPPPVTTANQTPPQQWSAIRKEKLREIDGAGKIFEEQTGKTWTETHKSAMENLQGMYPDKNLYDAAKSRATEIALKYDMGEIYNPTSEDLAVLQFLKAETDSRINNTFERMASDDQGRRTAALMEYDIYKNDLLTIAKAANPQEAGRAFNIRQLEAKVIDQNNGLQIRRMEFMKDKGGEKLTPQEMEWTAEQWEKEKDIMQREQELKEKGMQEAFDKQMQQLQSDYEKKLKDAGKEKKAPTTKTEKTLSQKGKDIADQIRKLKSDKGTLQSDITFGLRDLAVEAVAKLVEAGSTIAEAIGKVLEDAKFGALKKEELTNHILGGLEKQDNKAAAFEKIKDHAETNKVSDVTTDMVSKNFVRDYINSHIGETAPKDILNTAFNELKQILPDLTKEKLTEAYLKEGDFKQPSKKDLESQHSKDRKELVAITKLEEDIDDLKSGRDLKVRGGKSEREKAEHETKLINEKDALLSIKDRSEKEQKRVIELNAELDRITTRKEKEQKGQPKTKEVSEREQEILDKIKEEQDKWDAEKKAAADAEKERRELESEQKRQAKKVAELTDKIDKLQRGIRETKTKEATEKDTPQIEALKEQVKVEDKKLREIEKEQKREEDKRIYRVKKIADMDAKIRRLKERGELIKENSKKEPEEMDKTIQAMQDKLQKTLNEKGLKVSSEDKYAKSGQASRAKSHNDRLDAVSKKIEDRIDKGDLTQEQKDVLTKLKAKLDGSKVQLDPANAFSNEPVINQGLELVKKAKSEFDREAGIKNISVLGEFKKDLQRIIDGFNSDKSDSEQDIKLQRTKDQLKRGMAETTRKIAAGEFEDKPIVTLKKSDAELIKLQIENNKIQTTYQKKRQEYLKDKQSWYKRAAEFARMGEVVWLIHRFSTLVNVGSSALIRPFAEAVTKSTTGALFTHLPFETTKKITEQAKLGGESESLKSIKKGYEAYFRQFTPKQLEEKYEKANTAYEKSSKDYYEQRNKVEEIKNDPNKGENSKEYKNAAAQLQPMKDKMNNDLINSVGNVMYQYVGGSSIKDALQTLLHRTSQIEKEFGHVNEESLKKFEKGKIAGTAVDNLEYLVNFIGRSHSALKTFSGRFSFAAGFIARLEGNAANGIDISKPEKILEIAHDSYLDWDRGKYQESNPISDKWNELTNSIERVSPELAYIMKADVAITRVPVNMIREGVMEYTLGAFRAPIMVAREYYKAKGIVLKDDYTPENEAAFKKELGEQLQKIEPNQAAKILRAFRKGGFGLGMYALAMTGYVQFGGWAHKGQTAEDKKKLQREQEGGEPELKTTQIKIGNYQLPEWAAHVAEHAPSAAPLLYALGLGEVYNNSIKDGETTPKAATNAVIAQVDHVVNSIPIINKFVLPIAQGAVDNLGISKFCEWDGVDKDGNPEKRKAFRLEDYLQIVEGHGDQLLTEDNFKMATKIQKSYKADISDVERDPSLTKAEKEKQRADLMQQMKEEIDGIYKINKEDTENK